MPDKRRSLAEAIATVADGSRLGAGRQHAPPRAGRRRPRADSPGEARPGAGEDGRGVRRRPALRARLRDGGLGRLRRVRDGARPGADVSAGRRARRRRGARARLLHHHRGAAGGQPGRPVHAAERAPGVGPGIAARLRLGPRSVLRPGRGRRTRDRPGRRLDPRPGGGRRRQRPDLGLDVRGCADGASGAARDRDGRADRRSRSAGGRAGADEHPRIPGRGGGRSAQGRLANIVRRPLRVRRGVAGAAPGLAEDDKALRQFVDERILGAVPVR